MKKRSLLWKKPQEEMTKIVQQSNSFAEILRYFDMAIASGNYQTLKRRLDADKINYSHIKLGLNNNCGRESKKKIPLEKILVKNSSYCRKRLKKRLLKAGILKNECYVCGQLSFWNDKDLVMVLDHINGINNDNRKENLRMLCPNCNSQQPTFAGRNKRN